MRLLLRTDYVIANKVKQSDCHVAFGSSQWRTNPFTPLLSTKMADTKFYNKKGKEIQRTPCQVFTRVMGYLRPVNQYNIGKKSEFYSRKYFDQWVSENSKFVKQYRVVDCECNK